MVLGRYLIVGYSDPEGKGPTILGFRSDKRGILELLVCRILVSMWSCGLLAEVPSHQIYKNHILFKHAKACNKNPDARINLISPHMQPRTPNRPLESSHQSPKQHLHASATAFRVNAKTRMNKNFHGFHTRCPYQKVIASPENRLAVKELHLSYHNAETKIFTICPIMVA